MSNKSTYIVRTPTIIGGKHLTVGASITLTEKEADAIGERFVQLAKVETPAQNTSEAAIPAEKSTAVEKPAAVKTTAVKAK